MMEHNLESEEDRKPEMENLVGSADRRLTL
jgi:hypothetical protein